MDGVLVVFCAIILAVFVSNRYRPVQYVRSSVDGREYLVRKVADRQEAADILARLNAKVLRLIDNLVTKYPDDERVALLDDRYNPDALSEGSNDDGYSSYTINKGKRIVLCLRSRDKKDRSNGGKLEDENTLVYVLVHELAHLATVEVGHPPEFWKNFKFLVQEAVSLGVYKDHDYSKDPVEYCGVTIDSSSVTKSGHKKAAD